MYLKDCLIENVGPIEFLDVSLPFNDDFTPKPIILVGKNGSGKSVFTSYVVDALTEFAKVSYEDIVPPQGLKSPFFKFIGTRNQRTNSEFGIGLLQFIEGEQSFSYIDKSGILDSSTYGDKLLGRFEEVKSWPKDGNYKNCTKNKQLFEKFFRDSSVCYFPPSRKETPHWLNPESISGPNESGFRIGQNISGRLRKPIFIESSAEENKSWLLDVFLDSMVDFDTLPTNGRIIITSNLVDKQLLKKSREVADSLLKLILQDSSARLSVGYRNNPDYRLCIFNGDKPIVPSLDHLSSGQAILFNLFITVIRYADKGNINNSIDLSKINGIVIIDEVDAHLDVELQYDVLPKLLKQFPRIQFILTTHSPILLLGMKKQYGEEGFEIIEMPKGQIISTERFSEFQRSFDHFSNTKKFEEELKIRILEGTKPLVLTEGETDPDYIKAGLDALERTDILEKINVEWVGKRNGQGPINTGVSGLNNTRRVLEANPSILKHKLLLLYDCDTGKTREDIGLISIRAIPKNEENAKVKKGIENLFPMKLFDERFYEQREEVDDYGAPKIIGDFKKVEFCKWICTGGKTASNFQKFSVIIEILDEFLE